MEDYKEKYEQLIKRIKHFHETVNPDWKRIIESHVPELKVSEDERIREWLVEHQQAWLHDQESGRYMDNKNLIKSIKKSIEWLEKQGEQPNKVSIWKHWKDGIAGNGEGKPIYLVKSGNTYMLSSCLGFECDYIELSELDKLYVEQQGEQKPTPPIWKYKKDSTPLLTDSLILNKYGCVAKSPSGAIVSDVWVLDFDELAKLPKEPETQCEQKPVDNAEPKFKVGDFIVSDYCMGKVIELTNDAYLLDSGQGIPFSCEHNAHLWTINDAKDGDVLSCENGWTCIFKALDNYTNTFSSYCFMDKEGWFCEDGGQAHTIDNRICGEIHPATQEQRDLLFQKIKESGYEWDAEKKELRNMLCNDTER